MTFYAINLLIYAAVDAMACLGLSQQFGIAGVTNFGFIIFQAAGGYAAAILAMPPQTANGGFQTYIGGWNLPFPIPWIGAAVVGGAIALPFTFLVGRRLRGDFAAVGLLVTAVLLNLVVTNYRPVLNGDAGLSLIPQPLQGQYNPATASYQWVFAAVAILLGLGVYLFVRRITESPYGRSLRAMRDNDLVADSLGKSLRSMRTVMLVVGGAIAGLSRGSARLLHHHLGPGGLGLRRDGGAVRGGDHRRRGQPRGRGARGDPGAGGFRGGDAVHPDVEQSAAEPDPVAGMGGDRAAHRDLPVGEAAGDPARTEACHPRWSCGGRGRGAGGRGARGLAWGFSGRNRSARGARGER